MNVAGLVGVPPDAGEHGVDAVLRRRGTTSPGRPSPRTASVVGSRLQRAVEVDDVAVRVPLAEDRDETADDAGEAESGGVRRERPSPASFEAP